MKVSEVQHFFILLLITTKLYLTYTSRHEIHSDATDSDTTQQAANYEVTLNDRVPVFYTRPHGTLAGTLDAVLTALSRNVY